MSFRSSLLLVWTLCVGPSFGFAEITEGAKGGSVNYNIFVGRAQVSDEDSLEIVAQAGDVNETGSVALDGTADEGRTLVHADFTYTLSSIGRFSQQVDEFTGLAYTKIFGSLTSRAALSGYGRFLDSEDDSYSSVYSSLNPGNEAWNEFTIADDAETASVVVAFTSDEQSGNEGSLRIQRKNGEDWVNVAIYLADGLFKTYEDELELEPGDYRVLGSQATSGSAGSEKEFSLEHQIDYELTFGVPPGFASMPEEGDYSYPGFGTEFTDSPKLKILNTSIVSETDLGNGSTAIEFTVTLANTSFCPWSTVLVLPRDAEEGQPAMELQDDGVLFGYIEAQSNAATENTSVVHVANADLEAARAAIVDTSRLYTTGIENVVFRYPVTFVGENFLSEQREGSTELEFYQPTVDAGNFYVEWEPHYSVPLKQVSDGMGGYNWEQNFDHYLPILVKSTHYEQGTVNTRGYWSTRFEQYTLFDLVKHGTVRSVVENPFPQYTRTATENDGVDNQKAFPIPFPVHFNRLKFNDILKLSGNFNFTPGGFSVDFEMENGIPITVLIHNSYTAEINFLIETANHEEVGGESLVDDEKLLFAAPLFTVALPGGFTYTPSISVETGILANITRSLSVPFTTRLRVDVTAGVKNLEPYYEDKTTYEPLHMSDPGLYDEIGAELELWLKTELHNTMGTPSGFDFGATIGAKLVADFAVHPLATPWWEVHGDLKIFAGAEITIADLVDIVDAEHTLTNYDLFDFASGASSGSIAAAPTIQSFTVSPEGVNPGVRPLGKDTQRWSRSILSKEGYNLADYVFAVPIGDGSDVLVGESYATLNRLYRVAANGALLESLSSQGILYKPMDAVPMSDGGALLLVNQSSNIVLVRLSSDLEVAWSKAYSINGYIYKNLRLAATGSHVFVLGSDSMGTPIAQQPVVSCFTLDGEALWSRAYMLEEGQAIAPGDIIGTQDGNAVIAATTSNDFTQADGWSEDNLILNITHNGLLFKLDADTGDVIWGSLVPHYSGPTYSAVAERSDGQLTVGGTQLTTFPSTEPSMMLVQFSAAGEPLDMLLIGNSGGPRARGNEYTEHLYSDVMFDGETYYDQIKDLAWSDDGLWACGRSGIYNVGSVLNTGVSAFTIHFDEELNPSRYAIYGGPGQDILERILVTEDGPLAVGETKSFTPWPEGSREGESGSSNTLWLHKLPWEGRMDFHRFSSAAQPDSGDSDLVAGSYYVYPRVVSGSLLGKFDVNQPGRDVYGRGEDRISRASRAFTVLDQTLTPVDASFSLTDAEILSIKALEYQPRSLIVDQESYFTWYQGDADSDFDGDGVDLRSEFYFGTNPKAADKLAGVLEMTDALSLNIRRNKLAGETLPLLFVSEDMKSWTELEPVNIAVSDLDDNFDLLTLDIPESNEATRRFFKLALPD